MLDLTWLKDAPKRRFSWAAFLLGLFSMTKINLGGSIAISELVVVILTPFIFVREMKNFKKDGIKTLIVLTFLWLFGAIFSDVYNHNFISFALKGIATPVVYMC